ncbi:uncharacterized protein RCH25_025506 [Pelodytes ibericus]
MPNEKKRSLTPKEEGLLAALQAQEHTIYQLQSEKCGLKSQIKDGDVRVEHLQSKLDTSDKLYGQAKLKFMEYEKKISDFELKNTELKAMNKSKANQLEEFKMKIPQHSTMDTQNVSTGEHVHWHSALETLQSNSMALDKKYLETVKQSNLEKKVTKELDRKITNLTAQLDDTKKELAGVQADLVTTLQECNIVKKQLHFKKDLMQKMVAEHKDQINILENELKISQQNNEHSYKEILKLEQAIIEQGKEMKQLQHLYKDTVEKNGRLEAKIETHMITAQSEQDVLLNEISCKEEIIHTMKMQEMDHEEKLSIADKQIQQHKNVLQELHYKYMDVEDHVNEQEETMQSLMKLLGQANAAKEEATIEVNNCGETIRHLHLELASLQTSEDSARKTVIVKDHISIELYEECEKLKCILGEMQFKLSSSDVQNNELNAEVGVLRSELHKKTEEVHTLETQIQMQQESLNRASGRLKDTKKAAASKIHDKETKREALQKELLKAQNQYSACYDELVHREKLLHKLKEENIQLTEQIKQQSQDISKMSEERKKLELKLAVVTERHKTAQQEVNNRDQLILQLKTDLKTSQEKYFGSQEELGLQEGEVSRLQQKLKCLQTEARELWDKCSEQEDQLTQTEKAKQQLLHEKEIHLGQIQNYTMVVEKLQNDFDIAKQAHTTDLERWNQKSSLMQKELVRVTEANQQYLQKTQVYKDKIASLEINLENASAIYQEEKHKVEAEKEIVKKKSENIEHLKQHIKTLEQKIVESCSQSKAYESALELRKKKYRACIDTMKSLEKLVESLQKEVKDQASKMSDQKETIQCKEAEISILQCQYKEKSDQVQTFQDLIDQLTGELNSSKDDVKLNKEQSLLYEQRLKTMKEKVDELLKQVSESEDKMNTIAANFKAYENTHSHFNEEYNSQALHLQSYQSEIENMRNQLNEKTATIEDCQRVIEERNSEAANVLLQQKKYSLEIEELEKTLQSLQLDIMTSQQNHQVELAHLEQQIAQRDVELVDIRKICTHKDQAVSKRDDLLRKLEADLLQAREGIKEKASEAEHLDSVVKKLEESILDAEKKKNQKEKENNALQAEAKELRQELQDVHKLYRETAQELASHEEKLLLLESSLRATQEQLSEQIAQTVRQEQNSRKSQTELKTLKERVTASGEENSEYKRMLEKLKAELTSLKAEHHKTVQESLQLQQTNHKFEIEMASVREHGKNLQQQNEKYKEIATCLREELSQMQHRDKEEQTYIERLKKNNLDMENEMESLRAKRKSDALTIKDQDNRLMKLEEEISQRQEKYSCARGELLEAQAQLKICHLNLTTAEKQIKHLSTQVHKQGEHVLGMAYRLSQEHRNDSLQKRSNQEEEPAEKECTELRKEFHLVSDEVKNLKNELKIYEQKYSTAQKELEILRQALEATQTDNSRLHQESEFVAANVNQWIKEQKLANENLAEKIRDQNQLLARLTAERDHFQKMEETLSTELMILRTELEENKAMNERLKASDAEQESLLLKLRKQLENQETEHTSLLEEKLSATEDIHTRLKANIKSIHFLNQKLDELSQENGCLQTEFRHEKVKCQQLERQLETCNHTISNLSAQLKAKQEQILFLQQDYLPNEICNHKNVLCMDPRSQEELEMISKREENKGVVKRDLEEKSYWIQQVGELSAQLQENTEYWTEKMNKLAVDIQQKCMRSAQK